MSKENVFKNISFSHIINNNNNTFPNVIYDIVTAKLGVGLLDRVSAVDT